MLTVMILLVCKFALSMMNEIVMSKWSCHSAFNLIPFMTTILFSCKLTAGSSSISSNVLKIAHEHYSGVEIRLFKCCNMLREQLVFHIVDCSVKAGVDEYTSTQHLLCLDIQ